MVDAIGAGVRIDGDEHCFAVEAKCSRCGTEDRLVFVGKTLSASDWAKEIALMCGYVFVTNTQPEARRTHYLTAREPETGLTLLLGARKGAVLKLFGGYRRVGSALTLLLYRWDHPILPSRDGVLRIETRHRVRIAQLPDDEKLQPGDWEEFLNMPEGTEFRRESRRWRKLTAIEIEPLVRDRVYQIASLLRRRRK